MRCAHNARRPGVPQGAAGRTLVYLAFEDSVWVVTLVSLSICLFILIFRVVTSSISTCAVVNARGKVRVKYRISQTLV